VYVGQVPDTFGRSGGIMPMGGGPLEPLPPLLVLD
jgi:hypothetical protein